MSLEVRQEGNRIFIKGVAGSTYVRLSDLSALLNGLCAIPPVKALVGSSPLVLYCANDEERHEVATALEQAFMEMKSNARVIKV